ncbi:MAG: hypothetical protein K2W95_01610 [Candidatus Obscuribacterales bacterium]|nr:hypothetical protein [Candidatus Obscuribacterales bacterium]
MASKKVHAVLSAGYVVVQAGTPLIAYAQSAGTNLDLSSQDRSITAGSNVSNVAITIDGGGQKTFSAGDLLTPAEFVALTQVLSGGATAQTLNVASNGAALGGTFNLSTFASSAASIHIPQGVIGVSDAALGAINLSGNLSNSGTLYAISSNSNITSAVFSANNILNNQGALFSSMLPPTGLSGYTSVVSNLSLTLNAINDIINAGMISSAGALSLSAGGSIVNALPAGAVGVQPILQALGNVNMISAQLANAGMVNSLAGNINVNSHIAQSILINNVGGTLSALNGALNVRDASFDTGKFNLDIVGGDVLSKELNLFSANGKINIDVNDITGRINTESFELAVAANTPAIRMGNVIVTGDPIISNGSGDVIIEPDPDTAPAFLTNGGPLFVTAARNILSTAAIVDSGGGQIVFTAGGSIFLTSTSLITSGNGGHIVMIAQNGSITLSPAGTVSSGGYIHLSATGDINTGNLVTVNGGGVVIESGGNTSTGNISVSAPFGGGSVDIKTQMTSGGSETFFIGPPGDDGRHVNGVNGTITTTGSILSGFVVVRNLGLGGINVLSPDSIKVSGPNYGGQIALDAGAGDLQLGLGTLSTDGRFAGNIFLKGDRIIARNTTLSANGTGADGQAAGIFTSSAVLQVFGDLNMTASGSIGGGIQINSADSMDISTMFDFGSGLQRIIVDGSSSGSDLTVSGAPGSNVNVFALGTKNGGFISVNAGNLTLSGGSLTLDASGVDGGNGGDISVYVQGDLTNNTNSSLLTSSADVSGNAGTIDLFVHGDVRVGDGTGEMQLVANGGSTSGNGGFAFVASDGDISGSTSGISVATLGSNGNGGHIGLYGGTLTLDAGGEGFNADGKGIGNGGFIDLSASGEGQDIVFASGSGAYQASARGGSDGGSGGTIIANASGKVIVMDGSLDVSSGKDGFGGVISLGSSAANSGIQINADLNASGDAGGGLVFFQANDVSIGSSARISANATGGAGGQVLFTGTDNMTVQNKGVIDTSGSAASKSGSISYTSIGSVSVTVSGEQKGLVDATGSSVDIQMSKAGVTLELHQVSSTNGSTKINMSGAGSTLKIADAGSVSATGGQLSLGANTIEFGFGSTLSMDAPGLMLLDSGSLANSLNVVLPSDGQAMIQIGGGGARPGAVLFTARNGGNVSFTADGGKGSLDVSGATLSASSTTGNIGIGSDVSLSTDSYDELLDLGLELQAGAGNISVNGWLSASNLKLTTTEGGSITLGVDLNAPTIAISTTGAGTINQINGSSIGIGSLSLFSESGNIGSAATALKTNVLEVKVTSGGDVFIDNDSSLDLITSDVNGRFELTTNGDLAVESNVNSEILSFTANGGSISVMSTVESQGNATLAVSGDDTNISITGTVRSIGGSVTLNTVALAIAGGDVVAGGAGGVNINGGDTLSLTGAGGSIAATSSAASVNLTAGGTLDIANSINISAGSSGTVRLTAAGGETAGSITIGSGDTSTLSIGSQSSLALSASIITLANGSTISSGKTAGTAVSMSPGSGGSLTVVLPASAGGGINTAGGGVAIASGTNASLVFDNGGQLLDTDFTVSGGTLTTESSSGDTTLNGVNLVSNGNVNVNVHNGSLNMGGDITSSMAGGTIAILDPNGITVAGNGNFSFVNGGYGQILFAASGAGNDLTFSGTHAINPGTQGSVMLRSDASIVFGANSATSILNGATTVEATNVQFQSGSNFNSTSTVGFTSNSAGGLTVVVPSGGQATVNAVGAITFASAAGTAINFVNSESASALLAFAGAPVSIQTSNANVIIGSAVVLRSEQNLTVSTPGGTLINNGRLEIPVQSSTITIEASGNLYVNNNVSAKNIIVRTLSRNGNITLSSDLIAEETLRVSAHESGDIYQEEGLLKAGLLILESGSGNIGTKNGGAIRFTANNLEVSTKGSARLESVGAVTIQSANVGGTLNLKSSDNVTISGGSSIAVSANRLVINSQRDIVVNSDISANKVVLKTHNQGSIRGSATVRGDEVRLKTEKGNIGSSSSYLRTAAAELRIDTGKNASAFITELNSVELSKVNVGGSFYLTSGGNLDVNDINANNGSVSLIASGNIHLIDHSKIRVDEGNIFIQSTNQNSGVIRIGDHSTIEAYASKAPLGNVSFIVGASGGSPVKGTAPKSVNVSKKWGGEVYFGKNGITAEGKKNEINAWGSNVTFSTGNRPASAIILEGNVRITADPPPAFTEELQAPVSLAVPLAQPASALHAMAPTSLPALFNNTMVQPRVETVAAPQESVAQEEPAACKPRSVGYLRGSATLNKKTSIPKVSLTDAAFIKQSEGCMFTGSDGVFEMRDGEAIVHARRPLRVTSEGNSIFLQPGAIVLLKKDGANINVFNLFETNSGAVKVSMNNSKPAAVRVGSSFSVGASTVSIATRRLEHHEVDGTPVHFGEFSLLSLASNTTMLSGLLNSSNNSERKLASKLLKMAAALTMVTSGHGAYTPPKP